jgi:F-type H+-transporting ATPase subunit delta
MTSILGRNYARALFDLATETGSLDAVEADLRATRDVLFTDRAARAFLANRLIARPTKKRLVTPFEGKIDGRLLILLFLLVNRGRTRLLGEITEEFERLALLARGMRKVKVISAFPLSDAEKARVTASLSARSAARVALETEVRTSLIGGVGAASEGQEIEFTIEGQLRTLASGIQGK